MEARNGFCFITGGVAQSWWLDGVRHRIDGPAYSRISDKIPDWLLSRYPPDPEWWLDGKRYEFDEWLKITPIDEEQKLLIKLQYG
jgi:hypothetical protein